VHGQPPRVLVEGDLAASSPDCNPLDYYIWSVCEFDVNKLTHNSAALLMAKITEVMANLPRTIVALACKQFRHCILVVAEAGSNFLNIIISNRPVNFTCTFFVNMLKVTEFVL
jgi:hypothetical protein